MKTHQEIFEQQYNSEGHIAIMEAAKLLAHQQKQVKQQFATKESEKKGYADKMLTDIMLYRKQGKFKSIYHEKLYKKRVEYPNSTHCPVMVISLPMQEQEAYNKQYMAKVNSSAPTSFFKVKKMKKNLMNFNRAYTKFVNEYLMPVFLGRGIRFEIDERNEQVISDLVSYFTRQSDCKLDLTKGICLFGNVGTGKSTILRQMARFTTDMNLETQFSFVSMNDVYTGCDSSGLDYLDKFKFRTCAFDDIGMRGNNDVNNYGTRINAYRELVQRQYNRYTRPNPSLSHYTTNYPYNSRNENAMRELAEKFGIRELDRFREMCNFISLKGASRRKF